MRIIFFLMLMAFIARQGLSQEPTKKEIKKPIPNQVPSKKEMQAQLAEAKRDALKQVTDLEKDISLAKANNENQEDIKQMEDQLATMKKMLGVIEQVGSASDTRPKTLPAAKKAERKYVSPFEPIRLKQTVVAPTKEQARDQLLWYTGRRIDANTLITTSGMIVRYDRVNSRVLVQPDKRVDSPGYYYGMINTLAQTQRMKNDFAVQMDGIENSFFMYPEIQKAYDEYNFFRDRYYKIARNVITIGRPTVTRIARPDQDLEALHHALIVSMATLPSPYDIKLPPERPNDLCSCDPEERANYEQKLADWLEFGFLSEEENILHKLKEIYIHLDFRQQSGFGPPASIPNFKDDIIKGFNTVIERITIKIDELSKKYEAPKIYLEEGLVMATLSFKKLLMQTIADPQESSTHRLKSDAYRVTDRIENSIMNNTVFEKYMNDQKAVLNYNVIFDYSLYLGHEYNKKLLNSLYDMKENFFDTWVEGLKKFNRFTLTLTMEFQYTQTDNSNKVLLEADGKLESKPIIVSLARSSCSWYLYPTDANHRDRSGNEEPFQIPIRVLTGSKKIWEKDVPRTMPYTGPSEMRMVFPTFEISFCPGRNNDQALMDVLRYSNSDLQKHEKDKLAKVYTVDMLQFANKMFLGIMQVKDNTYDLASITGEMAKIKMGSVQLPLSTGDQKMDNILMNHFMYQKKREAQMSLARTTHTANTIFQFDAQNKSPVFVDKTHSTVDPNDKDKTWGIHFTLGLITLKVIHAPL